MATIVTNKQKAKHLAKDLALVAIIQMTKGNESTEYRFEWAKDIIRETEELLNCIDFLYEPEPVSDKKGVANEK